MGQLQICKHRFKRQGKGKKKRLHQPETACASSLRAFHRTFKTISTQRKCSPRALSAVLAAFNDPKQIGL